MTCPDLTAPQLHFAVVRRRPVRAVLPYGGGGRARDTSAQTTPERGRAGFLTACVYGCCAGWSRRAARRPARRSIAVTGKRAGRLRTRNRAGRSAVRPKAAVVFSADHGKVIERMPAPAAAGNYQTGRPIFAPPTEPMIDNRP